jgi:hypothetical protein
MKGTSMTSLKMSWNSCDGLLAATWSEQANERPLASTLFERPSKANSSTFIVWQQQSLTKIPLPYVGPHSKLLSKAVASGDEGASVISGGPITSRARKTILHHVWNSFLLSCEVIMRASTKFP